MKEIEITIEDYNKLVKATEKCVSNGDARPMLQFIKIEVRENSITAIALSGYILTKAVVSTDEPAEEFDMYIKPVKLPKGAGYVVLRLDDKGMSHVATKGAPIDVDYTFPKLEGDYFNFDTVIERAVENQSGQSILLNPNLMIQFLKSFSHASSIELFFTKNDICPICVKTNTPKELNTFGLILPVRCR